MEYKEKDKTRLDEAKERAKEILDKIPDSSQVFVVDSAEPGVPIALVAGRRTQADRGPDHPRGQPAAERRAGAGLPGDRRVRTARSTRSTC